MTQVRLRALDELLRHFDRLDSEARERHARENIDPRGSIYPVASAPLTVAPPKPKH